jgi:hypothetical protein
MALGTGVGLAVALVVLGLALAVWAVRRAIAQLRLEPRDPQRALAIVRGFRLAIVGLAAAGSGLGYGLDIAWLSGLSLVIGGEELLESSVAIRALEADRRRRAAASAG